MNLISTLKLNNKKKRYSKIIFDEKVMLTFEIKNNLNYYKQLELDAVKSELGIKISMVPKNLFYRSFISDQRQKNQKTGIPNTIYMARLNSSDQLEIVIKKLEKLKMDPIFIIYKGVNIPFLNIAISSKLNPQIMFAMALKQILIMPLRVLKHISETERV